MSFKSPNLGEAVADPKLLTQLLQMTLDSLENEFRKGDPVGRVALWPDGPDLPEGWIALDGSIYDQVKYPELYNMGAGYWVDTATTFTVTSLVGPAGWVYMIRAE